MPKISDTGGCATSLEEYKRKTINNNPKMKTLVKDDLIHFVKKIKSMTDVGMDKHLCDHLIWIIEEYYKKRAKK